MKLNPSTRRWLAGLGVIGAFVAASAAPAAAETTTPRVLAFFPDVTLAAGTGGVVRSAILYADETTVLQGVAVRYDYRALAGKVALDSGIGADNCDAPEEGVLVCHTPEVPVYPSGGTSSDVHIWPTGAAKLGDEGELKITVQAQGIEPATWTSQIRIGEGVDLAGPSTKLSVDIAKNNGNFSAPVRVSNVGETTAKGVVALFDNDLAITPADRWSNCYYADDILVACQFDEEIAAGETRSTTFHYALRPDTYAPGTVYGTTRFITPGDFEDLVAAEKQAGIKAARRGTGAKLTLGEATSNRVAQTDVEPGNNFSHLTVDVLGKRGADLAAIGAELRGKQGEIVEALLGVRNNGPATLDYSSFYYGEATIIDVAVPTGTTAVEVPSNCAPLESDDPNGDAGKPGAAKYRCFPGPVLIANQKEGLPFRLRIDKVVPNATGSVQVNVDCACEGGFKDDLKPANDTAKIVVNGTGDGSQGDGGQGDGGQGGGDGGTLPITGSATGLIAGLGALLLAAGVGGYAVARRRKTRFVA